MLTYFGGARTYKDILGMREHIKIFWSCENILNYFKGAGHYKGWEPALIYQIIMHLHRINLMLLRPVQ